MKEAKKLFLFLAGAALFIVVVGMLSNKNQGKPLFGDIKIPTKSSTPQTFKKIKVGDKDLSVTVADDTNERRDGLSGYTNLPENEGMLFVLDRKERPIFWMKGMKMSIDIIWITDGKIVQIDKNAEPEPGVKDENLKKYQPSTAVNYVLEVASGWSDRNNVEVGDNIQI